MLLTSAMRVLPTDHRKDGDLVRFQGAGEARCAPPRGFRSAEGVRSAWPLGDGPFGRTPSLKGKTAAQKLGIRYERKVLRALQAEWGEAFLASPWFKYEDASGLHWCQPDGVLKREKSATIFEVKARFSSDGWYQLRKLYAPVVKKAFLLERVNFVLVCRSFDPSTPFPEDFELISSPTHPLVSEVSVLAWRL